MNDEYQGLDTADRARKLWADANPVDSDPAESIRLLAANARARARAEQQQPGYQHPECSICRTRHGNEIIHPCE